MKDFRRQNEPAGDAIERSRSSVEVPPGREQWPLCPRLAIKDLGDIARLIEAHPALEATLPADVSQAIRR